MGDQQATYALRQDSGLFDYFVSGCEQRPWDRETECFCRFDVYGQFDLYWVLDRQGVSVRSYETKT